MPGLGIIAQESTSSPRKQLLKDPKHLFADGEPAYEVTFENVQAGLPQTFVPSCQTARRVGIRDG